MINDTNITFPAITQGVIGGEQIQTVNARDLHAFLESKQEFANWIKDRVNQYGFVEGLDFLINLSKTPNGGRPSKEYHISIDMAKELAMVERNEKGKQARQYFIECERKLKSTHLPVKELLSSPTHVVALLQGYAEQVIALKDENTTIKIEKMAMQQDVDAVKRIAGSDDLFGVRVTAKILDMPQKKFTDWIQQINWAYRQNGSRKLLCYADKHKAGFCRNVAKPYTKPDGSEGVSNELKFSTAGIVLLAKKLGIKLAAEDISSFSEVTEPAE